MYVLGISCYYHDAAAALLHDGVLVAAAEEERFSRRKHDHAFPQHAIAFCLQQAGIQAEDLDFAVFYEKPLPKFERILLTGLQTWPRSWRAFPEAMISWLTEKLHIRSLIAEALDLDPDQVLFVEHHLSHAASAFFCSPFTEAAVMTADGVGEWTTATLGVGQASWEGGPNTLELTREQRFPHSLGLFYSGFTAFLGFEVNDGEYKVMGMAPYGQPKYVDEVRRVIRLEADGSFWLDMDYFAFHYSRDRTIGPKFLRLFGEPRLPEAPFFTARTHPARAGEAAAGRNQAYADLAASVQAVTEDVLLGMARHLAQSTGQRRLCFAGGVAYNSAANGRLAREAPFEEIYIQPAAGDSGGALGAALYAYHVLLGQPRRFVMEHSFWGQASGEAAVADTLQQAGAVSERVDDAERLTERVADLFELPASAAYPARFMLAVTQVREDRRGLIPAVTHEDGSARVQAVRADTNPGLHQLIGQFAEATGVPVLLNTSFNLRGEPIVNTPADALSTFRRSGLDLLVLQNFLVPRSD